MLETKNVRFKPYCNKELFCSKDIIQDPNSRVRFVHYNQIQLYIKKSTYNFWII